jgi:hypothetical protein
VDIAASANNVVWPSLILTPPFARHRTDEMPAKPSDHPVDI